MGRPLDPAKLASREHGRRFYIGGICERGHGWSEGGAKRYASSGACVECVAIQAETRVWQAEDRDARIKERGIGQDFTFMGSPCSNGHGATEGQTLRSALNNACIACLEAGLPHELAKRERQGRAFVAAWERAHAAGETTYVGAPCKRGHGAAEGGTLRYTGNKVCVACAKERYRARDPFAALFG